MPTWWSDVTSLFGGIGSGVAVVAAVVSLASAYVAWGQKRQELRIGWVRDLVAWARDAMLAMSQAEIEFGRFHEMPPEQASAVRANLRARLSAAIDQGRLFFENSKKFRPDLLDPLMRAYRLLGVAPEKHLPQHLQRCMSRHRTEFWQLVQEKINPAWLRKAIGGPSTVAGDGAADFDVPDIPRRK